MVKLRLNKSQCDYLYNLTGQIGGSDYPHGNVRRTFDNIGYIISVGNSFIYDKAKFSIGEVRIGVSRNYKLKLSRDVANYLISLTGGMFGSNKFNREIYSTLNSNGIEPIPDKNIYFIVSETAYPILKLTANGNNR